MRVGPDFIQYEPEEWVASAFELSMWVATVWAKHSELSEFKRQWT